MLRVVVAALELGGRRAGLPVRDRVPRLRRRPDVAAVPMRLLPPEGLAQEQRTAALALRVHRTVSSRA